MIITGLSIPDLAHNHRPPPGLDIPLSRRHTLHRTEAPVQKFTEIRDDTNFEPFQA